MIEGVKYFRDVFEKNFKLAWLRQYGKYQIPKPGEWEIHYEVPEFYFRFKNIDDEKIIIPILESILEIYDGNLDWYLSKFVKKHPRDNESHINWGISSGLVKRWIHEHGPNMENSDFSKKNQDVVNQSYSEMNEICNLLLSNTHFRNHS